MALKFLNKKGWHTGSLRNIENVWKAEQKHDAENKKLDELRKQIQEERERSEFRLLQEQAGLVPKQERLDFLYDSGLAVGKGSSDGFKALEALPSKEPDPTTSSSKQQPSAPGALFEEKPQSANDAWRKLHSDPLLLIRQREQEALAKIKNNPIQMAKIKESVKTKKKHEKHEDKEYKKKKKRSTRSSSKEPLDSKDNPSSKGEERRERSHRSNLGHHQERQSKGRSDSENDYAEKRERERKKRSHYKSKHSRSDSEDDSVERLERSTKSSHDQKKYPTESKRVINDTATPTEADWRSGRPRHKQRQTAVKLTEEEKAARLREMQMDAELHEEQRWKRLKKASENDALEEKRASTGHKQHNFLDAAQKSVYGTEKGRSSTIEESVRRRTYFLQGKSAASETNAFRR